MVSIIMTAYNAEKTIERAIKSVINQTYTDIELIIIEDCSSDNTYNIIDSYCKKDNRIKLYKNEYNIGAGLSRRKGLKYFKGDYTLFLDSDDYIDSEYIQILLNYIKQTDADIICTGLHIVDFNENLLYSKLPKKLQIVTGKDKYKPDEADVRRFIQGNLIKKHLWDKVTYSERRYIEDTPTLFKLTYYANKIAIVPYAGMYYTQNPNSLIHTATKLKNAIYIALAAKDNYLFAKEKGISNYEGAVISAIKNIQENLHNEDSLKYKNELYELFIFFLKTFNF